MKTKIATLVLLTVTAGSASAHGGEVVTGLVVGAVVGNMIASQSRAAVTVHYGGYAPPLVVHAPPPGRRVCAAAANTRLRTTTCDGVPTRPCLLR
jgi:hypothetical protein